MQIYYLKTTIIWSDQWWQFFQLQQGNLLRNLFRTLSLFCRDTATVTNCFLSYLGLFRKEAFKDWFFFYWLRNVFLSTQCMRSEYLLWEKRKPSITAAPLRNWYVIYPFRTNDNQSQTEIWNQFIKTNDMQIRISSGVQNLLISLLLNKG